MICNLNQKKKSLNYTFALQNKNYFAGYTTSRRIVSNCLFLSCHHCRWKFVPSSGFLFSSKIGNRHIFKIGFTFLACLVSERTGQARLK